MEEEYVERAICRSQSAVYILNMQTLSLIVDYMQHSESL